MFSIISTTDCHCGPPITVIRMIGCCSEKEFVEIMAGLGQNTTDSLIEEHANKIKEEIA